MPSRLTGTARDALPLPATCIYVGPHSPYANPFRVGDRGPSLLGAPMDARTAVELFAAMLNGPVGRLYAGGLARTLHGFDLMCTCPLDVPCHADVLLALASDPGVGSPGLRAACSMEGPR